MINKKNKIYEKNGKLYKCPLNFSMDILNGKWRSLILWHINIETLRFKEIQRIVPDISKKVLSEHLKALEKNQLISRKSYPEVPPRVEYSITVKGQKLGEILNQLENFGREILEEK